MLLSPNSHVLAGYLHTEPEIWKTQLFFIPIRLHTILYYIIYGTIFNGITDTNYVIPENGLGTLECKAFWG